jgi:hypothetical protein
VIDKGLTEVAARKILPGPSASLQGARATACQAIRWQICCDTRPQAKKFGASSPSQPSNSATRSLFLYFSFSIFIILSDPPFPFMIAQ